MNKTKIEQINNNTWAVFYVERTAGKQKEIIMAYVKGKEVNELKNILSKEWMHYSEIVKQLIITHGIHKKEKLKLNDMLSAFNGGRFRKPYYFKFYYYPLIVLEFEKKVERKCRKTRLIK